MVRSMVLGILMCATVAGPLYAQAAPAAAAQPAKTSRTFTSDGAIFLVFIKPDKTADYEKVMGRVKDALMASDKPEKKEQAAGLKLFKSPDPAGANVLYVVSINPAVKGADYDVVNILQEAFPAEAPGLYSLCVGSFAQGQNIINLN